VRFEGCQQAVVIEQRRPQIGHRLPHGVHRILEQAAQLLEGRSVPALCARGVAPRSVSSPIPSAVRFWPTKSCRSAAMRRRSASWVAVRRLNSARTRRSLSRSARSARRPLGHVAPDAPVAQKRAIRVE
jgi:hypothetical protein